MNDQANTLRDLMKLREGTAKSAGPDIFVFASPEPDTEREHLLTLLQYIWKKNGHSVYLDRSFTKENIARLEGESPVRKAHEGKEVALRSFPRGIERVLMDSGFGYEKLDFSLHSPSVHSVVTLRSDTQDLTKIYTVLKMLWEKRQVTRAGLVLTRTEDSRLAQNLFKKLSSITDQFTGLRLSYLGHCPKLEESLLELELGKKHSNHLELVSKRLAEWGTEFSVGSDEYEESVSEMELRPSFLDGNISLNRWER